MSQSPSQNTAVELDASDLPVFCPNPKMTLWSQHPRVYLDVTHEGQARCPYCSTLYRLKPGVKLPQISGARAVTSKSRLRAADIVFFLDGCVRAGQAA